MYYCCLFGHNTMLCHIFLPLHQGIRNKVKQFAADPRHKRAQCCVLCVLSHGENGAIYGTDGEPLPVDELKAHLNAKSCKALKDKPKLIFLQACRGGEVMANTYCSVYRMCREMVPGFKCQVLYSCCCLFLM